MVELSSGDLPEPEKSRLSPLERRWLLYGTINVLLFLYASLHKLWMPIIKNVLRENSGSIFNSVDWFWPFHGILIFFFLRRKSEWLRLSAIFGIGYSLARLGPLVWIAQRADAILQWGFLSLLITEGFTIFFLTLVFRNLVTGETKTRGVAMSLVFLTGVMLGILLTQSSGFQAFRNESRTLSGSMLESKDIRIQGSPFIFQSCGAKIMILNSSTLAKSKRVHSVTIEECGLRPSIAYMEKPFSIDNKTSEFLNIAIHGRKNPSTPWVFRKNLALFPGKSVQIEEDLYRSFGILRVQSDSRPNVGMSLLLTETFQLEDFRAFQTKDHER